MGKFSLGSLRALKDLSVARSELDPEVPWTGDKASLGALRVDRRASAFHPELLTGWVSGKAVGGTWGMWVTIWNGGSSDARLPRTHFYSGSCGHREGQWPL